MEERAPVVASLFTSPPSIPERGIPLFVPNCFIITKLMKLIVATNITIRRIVLGLIIPIYEATGVIGYRMKTTARKRTALNISSSVRFVAKECSGRFSASSRVIKTEPAIAGK